MQSCLLLVLSSISSPCFCSSKTFSRHLFISLIFFLSCERYIFNVSSSSIFIAILFSCLSSSFTLFNIVYSCIIPLLIYVIHRRWNILSRWALCHLGKNVPNNINLNQFIRIIKTNFYTYGFHRHFNIIRHRTVKEKRIIMLRIVLLFRKYNRFTCMHYRKSIKLCSTSYCM